jgi:hypothetical protein
MRFWKDDDKLERELRASRPEPGDELVTRISKRLRHVERPRVFLRLGLASGLTAALLVAVASVGGFGQGAHAVGKAVGLSHADYQLSPSQPQDLSSGDDEYKEQRKQCKKTEDARHMAAQAQIDADFRACQASVESIHQSHLADLAAAHDAALSKCGQGAAGQTCRTNANAAYDAAKLQENQDYLAAKAQCEATHDAAKAAEYALFLANQDKCRSIGKTGSQ